MAKTILLTDTRTGDTFKKQISDKQYKYFEDPTKDNTNGGKHTQKWILARGVILQEYLDAGKAFRNSDPEYAFNAVLVADAYKEQFEKDVEAETQYITLEYLD